LGHFRSLRAADTAVAVRGREFILLAIYDKSLQKLNNNSGVMTSGNGRNAGA
jgi:hypothetical protein